MRKQIIFGIGTTMFYAGPIAQANILKESNPNILCFIADNCSFKDMECYGSKDSKIPNISPVSSCPFEYLGVDQDKLDFNTLIQIIYSTDNNEKINYSSSVACFGNEQLYSKS